MRKAFHSEEVTFLPAERSRGRENFTPTNWWRLEERMWTTRACRRRTERGIWAESERGELGISRETPAESGRARDTASRTPPALRFRAVANSRNSLPLSSRARTNTGIARGNLSQFLRFFTTGLRVTGSLFWQTNSSQSHLSCQSQPLHVVRRSRTREGSRRLGIIGQIGFPSDAPVEAMWAGQGGAGTTSQAPVLRAVASFCSFMTKDMHLAVDRFGTLS